MRAAVPPFADARTDYAVFSGLAERLGFGEAFTQGRNEMAWVEHLYEETAANAVKRGVVLPDFETFWEGEQIHFGDQLPAAEYMLEKFRRNPAQYPLATPSGKIEIFSETVANFGYEDCAGHPRWYDRNEWLGGRPSNYPLHLVSNQPKHKLHSQFDHGRASRAGKIAGRETARMNPSDATARGLQNGQMIKIFNARGSCLAGVSFSEDVMPGVIELPTGAWFDPQQVEGENIEVHGNPNVLTPDIGTSKLAQGCSAHTCMVEVTAFVGPLPQLQAFSQPKQLDP